MIQRYRDLKKQEKNRSATDRRIQNEKLFRVERGLYASTPHVTTLEKLAITYPEAVFTGPSAFYFWGMTNDIPDYYYLATHRDGAKIRSPEVIQKFIEGSLLSLGKTTLTFEGIPLVIYDKERMLIDLIRFRSRYPLNFYKEIIRFYRSHLAVLDLGKVEAYLAHFPHASHIMEVIQKEVF